MGFAHRSGITITVHLLMQVRIFGEDFVLKRLDLMFSLCSNVLY